MGLENFLHDLRLSEKTFLSKTLGHVMYIFPLKRAFYSMLVRYFRFLKTEFDFFFFSDHLHHLAQNHAITYEEAIEFGSQQHFGLTRELGLFLADNMPNFESIYSPKETRREALARIFDNDDLDGLKEFMKDPSFSIDELFIGMPIIYESAARGAVSCFRHLLINNADISSRPMGSLLSAAFRGNSNEIIQICLERQIGELPLESCLNSAIFNWNHHQIKWILQQDFEIKNTRRLLMNMISSYDFHIFDLIGYKTPDLSSHPATSFDMVIPWFEFIKSKLGDENLLSVTLHALYSPAGNHDFLLYLVKFYPEVFTLQKWNLVYLDLFSAKIALEYGECIFEIPEDDDFWLFTRYNDVEYFHFLVEHNLCQKDCLSQLHLKLTSVHPNCLQFLLEQGKKPSEEEILQLTEMGVLTPTMKVLLENNIQFPVIIERNERTENYFYLLEKMNKTQ